MKWLFWWSLFLIITEVSSPVLCWGLHNTHLLCIHILMNSIKSNPQKLIMQFCVWDIDIYRNYRPLVRNLCSSHYEWLSWMTEAITSDNIQLNIGYANLSNGCRCSPYASTCLNPNFGHLPMFLLTCNTKCYHHTVSKS